MFFCDFPFILLCMAMTSLRGSPNCIQLRPSESWSSARNVTSFTAKRVLLGSERKQRWHRWHLSAELGSSQVGMVSWKHMKHIETYWNYHAVTLQGAPWRSRWVKSLRKSVDCRSPVSGHWILQCRDPLIAENTSISMGPLTAPWSNDSASYSSMWRNDDLPARYSKGHLKKWTQLWSWNVLECLGRLHGAPTTHFLQRRVDSSEPGFGDWCLWGGFPVHAFWSYKL